MAQLIDRPGEYPAENSNEPLDLAAIRVGNAVRAFLLHHYGHELAYRGDAFIAQVLGNLFAMAFATMTSDETPTKRAGRFILTCDKPLANAFAAFCGQTKPGDRFLSSKDVATAPSTTTPQ